MASIALSVENLSWHYQTNHILSQVNLTLEAGKTLGVIGPNGAGKSSLLRCLYRYIAPSSGDIYLSGVHLSRYSANAFAKHVAVVLQDTPTMLHITTYQLVAMGLTPHKGLFEKANKDDDDMILAAIEKVGLAHKCNQVFETLSGGEKQRALIARAIVQQPKLLILDEPTNHLDIRYQVQIMELVNSLGITVIATIHDLNLASAMCDQLLLLNQGEVVASGSPEKVLTQSLIKKVFEVECEISVHPLNQTPVIQYDYQSLAHGAVKEIN